jgi:cellobiose phosphorylase
MRIEERRNQAPLVCAPANRRLALRPALESIRGFRVQGTTLLLAPCVPEHWPRAEIVFKYCSSRYLILIENPNGVSHGVVRAELDGKPLPGVSVTIPLVDDGATHHVRLQLGGPGSLGTVSERSAVRAG